MKKPEEILKQNPGSVIFARYAEHLAQEGQVDKAIEILEKGIEANPSYAFGHSVLANVLRGRQIPKRVTGEFKKALELDPQSPGDLFNFGRHYLEINQPEKALQFLELALKFEPVHSGLRDLYEEALGKSKAVVDLGLSDETAGALTSMFGEEEEEEQEVASGADVSDIAQKEPDVGKMVAEEPEPIDFQEVGEEPFVQSEETEEESPGDEGLESLMKTFGGEDVGIEAQEETGEEPIDAVQSSAVEEGSVGDEGLESLMKTFGGEDVDNLLEKIGDEEEPALEETEEEPETPFAVEVDEEYAGDLAKFKGIEVSDEERVHAVSADEDGAPFLEIDEASDYDPSRFESEVSEGEPVLSEEERSELLSFEKAEDEDVVIESDTGDTEVTASGDKWDSPLQELLVDEEVSEKEEPESPEFGNVFGDLSMEEINVLSEQETLSEEGALDLESETSEGIDYSDVLAEVSGEKSSLSSFPVDIEEALDEAQPYGEQVDSDEEKQKELSFGDKMILDIGEVSLHGDVELPDSIFSETGEIRLEDLDGSAMVEEPEGEVSEETLVEPETGIAVADEGMETVHHVEEIIKLAPDFELSVDQYDDFLVDTDVKDESVDHLLDEYMKTLNEASDESACIGESFLGDDSKQSSEKVIVEEEDRAPSGDQKNEADKDVTATMAEIYISQGFVSRGMEIYRILIQDNPDNEQYIARLRELESMHEQSSED